MIVNLLMSRCGGAVLQVTVAAQTSRMSLQRQHGDGGAAGGWWINGDGGVAGDGGAAGGMVWMVEQLGDVSGTVPGDFGAQCYGPYCQQEAPGTQGTWPKTLRVGGLLGAG